MLKQPTITTGLHTGPAHSRVQHSHILWFCMLCVHLRNCDSSNASTALLRPQQPLTIARPTELAKPAARELLRSLPCDPTNPPRHPSTPTARMRHAFVAARPRGANSPPNSALMDDGALNLRTMIRKPGVHEISNTCMRMPTSSCVSTWLERTIGRHTRCDAMEGAGRAHLTSRGR